MSQEDSLDQIIMRHYDRLPRAERQLADVVLGKAGNLHEYKAHELAQEAQVSKATAARFFSRLGYSSFRVAKHRSMHQEFRIAPASAKFDALANKVPHAHDLHLSTDIQNLRHTFETLPQERVTDCINALSGAEKLWVVGFEDDFALAHYARALLIRVKPDVRFLPLSGFSVPEEFASITPRDVILGFGIRRRTSSLRRILGSGCDAGAQVYLVCGEHTEEQGAITYLHCRTRGASLFDSMTAPVSLVSHMCSAVAANLGEPAIERMHRIESLHSVWNSEDERRTK
ncbi:MurR/RpiR family transcriptional regulator [Natronospirillum operosum]|uniref:MurR/RpiR family transcriptional regulator n=1 Tax=Natronospirillum operosum TaxID=2759953 RepID=A0A4Z0WE86_9GAMM|nr:MurR/RpiR family transcriptional regulator [Natronospirillum operosum]TGG93562.1 MurR/RpiR family transcriptional regulator [Natronospirillum operosum]